jgi:hypothetical protein
MPTQKENNCEKNNLFAVFFDDKRVGGCGILAGRAVDVENA